MEAFEMTPTPIWMPPKATFSVSVVSREFACGVNFRQARDDPRQRSGANLSPGVPRGSLATLPPTTSPHPQSTHYPTRASCLPHSFLCFFFCFFFYSNSNIIFSLIRKYSFNSFLKPVD